MRIDCKVALIFGAGRENIGLATARKFEEEGYVVIGSDITADGLPAFEPPIFDGFYSIDITDKVQVDKLFADIKNAYGRLDVVVNSAGVNILGPIDDYSLEKFNQTIAINLTSQYLILAAYVANFDNDGLEKTFLAVTSDTGSFLAKTSSFAYAASKAGANAFLQCTARELDKYHKDKWNILAFAAGMVEGTPMDIRTINDLTSQRGISEEEARKMLTTNIPKGRGMKMTEAADWIYFMTTRGTYASGNIIRVDNFQQQG